MRIRSRDWRISPVFFAGLGTGHRTTPLYLTGTRSRTPILQEIYEAAYSEWLLVLIVR